jgi:hypothetical protein
MSMDELKKKLREAKNAKRDIEAEIGRLENALAETIALNRDGIRIGDRVKDEKGHGWIVENIKLWSFDHELIEYYGVRLNKDGGTGKLKLRAYISRPIANH